MPHHRRKRRDTGPAARANRDSSLNEALPSTFSPAQDGASAQGFPWRTWYVLIPLALAVACSANILWNGFVADDSVQILQNAGIRSLANIPTAFVTSVWSFAKADIVFSIDNYFRPIFNIFLTAAYPLFETSAWAWHLASILVHASVVVLVFFITRELTEDNWVGLLASALFAVHPSHAESVAWISGVTDPLLALFALSAFYLYWRYKRTGRQSLILFALVLYLAALLTKETAIALPVVVLYCELFYFTDGVPAVKRIARAFFLGAVFAVPTLIYMALRWYALNGFVASTGSEYPAVPAIKTLPLALAKYLSLSIIPYGYSYQHFTPAVNSIFSVRFLLPCLVIALVTAAVAISKSRTLLFAAIWFLAWLAPALLAIRRFESESLVQDRYLYLPTVGACLAIALGVRWCARRLRREGEPTTAAIALAAPVLLGMFAISAFAQAFVRQNAVWRDNLSLYANCAEMNPDSAHAHEALAGAYYAIGDKSAAQRELMTGFDIDSDDPRAYLLQSYFAQTDGSAERALYYLKRGAETVKPNPYTRYQLATLYLNLGFLYERRSQPDLAEASMEKSLEIWPRPVGWYYLGQFYLDQGRYEKAVGLFDETLRSTPPRFAPIHLKLARAYDGLGNSATAKQEYERYLQLDPQAADRAEVQKRLSQM